MINERLTKAGLSMGLSALAGASQSRQDSYVELRAPAEAPQSPSFVASTKVIHSVVAQMLEASRRGAHHGT
jgi:hypothetical protein